MIIKANTKITGRTFRSTGNSFALEPADKRDKDQCSKNREKNGCEYWSKLPQSNSQDDSKSAAD